MIPFFHFGRPKNACEWRCYAAGKLCQHLKVRWWFGISSPRRAKWFFGILIWGDAPEGEPKVYESYEAYCD